MKEALLKAFEALAPKVAEIKARLENDAAAIAISSILSEPQGLCLVEYLINPLSFGKKPVYLATEFISKDRLSKLIETVYFAQEQTSRTILLAYYNEVWIHGADDPAGFQKVLEKLAASAAARSTKVVLKLCLDCSQTLRDHSLTKCRGCSSTNLLEIVELTLADQAKAALKQGQFLEIYVKACLVKSGVDLIGYPVNKRGLKGHISIEYQIQGEPVEIDVHGLAQPPAILLCEVKTVQKITINELRRVDSVYQGLIDRVMRMAGKDPGYLKLFIITGEFDQNVPRKAYLRKGWELIDRGMIPTLVAELKRIQQEL